MFYSMMGFAIGTPGLETYPRFVGPESFKEDIFAVDDTLRMTTYLFAPMTPFIGSSAVSKAWQFRQGFEAGNVVYFQRRVIDGVSHGMAMADTGKVSVQLIAMSPDVLDLLGCYIGLVIREANSEQTSYFGATASSDTGDVFAWVGLYQALRDDGTMMEIQMNTYRQTPEWFRLTLDDKVKLFQPVAEEAASLLTGSKLILS